MHVLSVYLQGYQPIPLFSQWIKSKNKRNWVVICVLNRLIKFESWLQTTHKHLPAKAPHLKCRHFVESGVKTNVLLPVHICFYIQRWRFVDGLTPFTSFLLCSSYLSCHSGAENLDQPAPAPKLVSISLWSHWWWVVGFFFFSNANRDHPNTQITRSCRGHTCGFWRIWLICLPSFTQHDWRNEA